MDRDDWLLRGRSKVLGTDKGKRGRGWGPMNQVLEI